MRFICKNCNQQFKGNYCNNCGQTADTHEINRHYLWHTIQHGVFHVDNGIIYTTKELFTRPGYAIKEYITGKRVKHFNPFAYVIILSTLYVLIAHFLHIDLFDKKISVTLSGDEGTKVTEIIGVITGISTWIKDHYAYSTLMLLPVFSLASYLAFKKSGYNYLKHLILNTYIAGQRTVIYILFIPIFACTENKDLISAIGNIEYLVWIVLMTWTYIQFFNNNKGFENILRTLLSFLYTGILMFLLMVFTGILLAIMIAK